MASNPSSAVIGERETLRAQRKLRLLTEDEAGNGIEFVPAGIFGFTASPGTEGVPVFTARTFQAFEIHKLGDDSVHYVGYMPEEDANALDGAAEPLQLKLYPEPYEKAQRFVSVPAGRIIHTHPASREHGNWFAFTIVPA
jgi:hypothetical protein